MRGGALEETASYDGDEKLEQKPGVQFCLQIATYTFFFRNNLHIVYVSLGIKTVYLNSCDRYHVACKATNICFLSLGRKYVPHHELEDGISVLQPLTVVGK